MAGGGVVNPTVHSLHSEARRQLQVAGCDSPALDARIFVKKVFGLTDTDLIAGEDREATAAEMAVLAAMMQRRLSGEPVSRILGQKEFWGLTFTVTPAVLDPRPDTETIVQAAVMEMQAVPPKTILDLGTGSGCLVISLLKEFPEARGTAVDVSAEALAVAKMNAESLGVADRITFIHGAWFDKVTESYDLIVSNPPYIPLKDIESLSPEVRNHDPILALTGGDDGYDAYRIIVKEIKNHLNPGGLCYLETGFDQGENVARLAGESNLSVRRIIPDLSGIPRAVEITRGDN
jgi:release factor glutamine methyltransferase